MLDYVFRLVRAIGRKSYEHPLGKCPECAGLVYLDDTSWLCGMCGWRVKEGEAVDLMKMYEYQVEAMSRLLKGDE